MSIVCLSNVMRHSEAKGGARLVLFVLAEHAHDDGTESYPTVETLAERSRMTRKGTQLALRRLEADGEIERTGFGHRGQTKWRVIVRAERGGEPCTPREDQDPQGRNLRPEGGVPRTPEPTTEPSLSLEGESAPAREPTQPTLVAVPDAPEVVWRHYVAHRWPGYVRALPADERRVIVAALRVATADECCEAIDGCWKSEWHQGGNPSGVKYVALSQILRGKQGGKTTREQVDFMRGFIHARPVRSKEAEEADRVRRDTERLREMRIAASEGRSIV